MKYWFDTEFIERPYTIDLISIGIVSEDGRELYLINNEFDSSKASDWVKENVISQLPEPEDSIELWMSKGQIANEIKNFVGSDKPEFWAYYADYDWVVFCWLFGTMMDLPKGWPMYCRDIKQWADQLVNRGLPAQSDEEHHALADARWNKTAWEFLSEIEKGK